MFFAVSATFLVVILYIIGFYTAMDFGCRFSKIGSLLSKIKKRQNLNRLVRFVSDDTAHIPLQILTESCSAKSCAGVPYCKSGYRFQFLLAIPFPIDNWCDKVPPPSYCGRKIRIRSYRKVFSCGNRIELRRNSEGRR